MSVWLKPSAESLFFNTKKAPILNGLSPVEVVKGLSVSPSITKSEIANS